MSSSAVATTLTFELSDATLDRIAERVAARIAMQAKPAVYVTTEEACELLRCTDRHVRRLVAEGRILATKNGRRVLVLRSSIETFLAEGRK